MQTHTYKPRCTILFYIISKSFDRLDYPHETSFSLAGDIGFVWAQKIVKT